MTKSFLYDYATGYLAILKHEQVIGLKGDRLAIINSSESIASKCMTINLKDNKAFITSITSSNPIKVNKEVIPNLVEFQITPGDIIELSKGCKALYTDNENITEEEARTFLGKMIYGQTLKGHQDVLLEKRKKIDQLFQEYNQDRELEKESFLKWEKLKAMKVELANLERENPEQTYRLLERKNKETVNQITILKEEYKVMEERFSSKKVTLDKKEQEKKVVEMSALDKEEELLQIKLMEVAKKKKMMVGR